MVHVSMFYLTHCSCGVLFQNSYVAIIRLACGSTPRAIASAYAFFPPVQSKIAPLISLTLHSQRRSSMVCFRVAHRDSQTHPGLRIPSPVSSCPLLPSQNRHALTSCRSFAFRRCSRTMPSSFTSFLFACIPSYPQISGRP